MAESIFERVSRLLSGKLEDSVDRLEQAGGAAVMREAIREVDRAIDQLRSDHEGVVTRRLQAARQRKMLAEHVHKLTEKAKFAVSEGRDDLAEFEQQSAQCSQVEAAAREEEQRLENSITALRTRKTQMDDALSAFLASQKLAQTGGDGPTHAPRNVEHQVSRSEQAFSRAMAGAGGLGPTRTDAETISRVAEIDGLQRSAVIAARIAKLKQ
nr:PspA/IM30 family protein [Hyphomicrobium sp.]